MTKALTQGITIEGFRIMEEAVRSERMPEKDVPPGGPPGGLGTAG
jgi:hypothetical protein